MTTSIIGKRTLWEEGNYASHTCGQAFFQEGDKIFPARGEGQGEENPGRAARPWKDRGRNFRRLRQGVSTLFPRGRAFGLQNFFNIVGGPAFR